MVATKYTYSIAGDTAQAKLVPGKLGEEIGESSIVIALDYINSSGDVLDVWMKDSLSAGDETILDGVVAAHDGVPLANPTTSDGKPIFHLDTPTEQDGKPVLVMSPATTGWKTWFFGRDDQMSPTVRGSGSNDLLFDFASGSGESILKELCFSEPIELHDGQSCWRPVANFDLEDIINVSVFINSSSVSSSVTGNCNLVDQGGYNAIVPSAPNSGSYYIDLANDAYPILVDDESNPDGYWQVDKETGVLTAAITTGKGNCNLLDLPIDGFLIKNVHIGHEHGVMDIDVYKTEWMHNKWKLRMRVTKNSPGAGKVAAWILSFRKSVT